MYTHGRYYGKCKHFNNHLSNNYINKHKHTIKYNTYVQEFKTIHKIGQHPELSRAVPHPSTDVHRRIVANGG